MQQAFSRILVSILSYHFVLGELAIGSEREIGKVTALNIFSFLLNTLDDTENWTSTKSKKVKYTVEAILSLLLPTSPFFFILYALKRRHIHNQKGSNILSQTSTPFFFQPCQDERNSHLLHKGGKPLTRPFFFILSAFQRNRHTHYQKSSKTLVDILSFLKPEIQGCVM